MIQILEGPVTALALERVREGEAALALTDRFADGCEKIGADAVGAALVDGVAGRALGEDLFTGRNIGAGEQGVQARSSSCAAFALSLHAFDCVAHRFGAFGME